MYWGRGFDKISTGLNDDSVWPGKFPCRARELGFSISNALARIAGALECGFACATTLEEKAPGSTDRLEGLRSPAASGLEENAPVETICESGRIEVVGEELKSLAETV